MRKWISGICSVLLFLAGVGLLCYPQISDYVNRIHSSQAVQNFADQLQNVADEALAEQFRLANAYNTALDRHDFSHRISGDYYEILDFGNGMMGYISIPCIDVLLPIYHGVSPEVLQKGVGHLPQTAFPIGGIGNHCVLTGHTGLPSAKLFTELCKLEPGDRFYITVGDHALVYQVDQIKVVTPADIQDLIPVDGQDYCTLVTCTPYGINSHRLLVRGRRVPSTASVPNSYPSCSRSGRALICHNIFFKNTPGLYSAAPVYDL